MDIVAGIALAVAAILTAAQSVWAIVGPGHEYSAFEYGFYAALIPFWACSLVALVGGIMLSVAGSGSVRIRTIAALGGGALFVTVARGIVILCVDSYVRLSAGGNWLAIPAAIAILAAVGTLIAAPSGSSAPPASPSVIPGYSGAAPYPGPAVYSAASAVQPGYPAPAVPTAPESAAPIPAPHGWPSYPGATVPGYPGVPAPAYFGAPGYPPAPSGSQGDPNAAAGPQPGYPSSLEQRGGPESSSAPTVNAGPSGAPPSEPHLPQQ
ncbi:hypothetical protein ACIBQ0_11500 [Nocardia nova]|uniref:hypothetical protein n=1 Tax=Nocardia nova TaxID=37330 RepID=UPI00378A5EB7